jgi:prepilin-type N-terminal cleavage/methylation domain-containing protein
MVKRSPIEGFTLIESLLVLTALSVSLLWSVPLWDDFQARADVRTVIDEMAVSQLEAIRECQYVTYDNADEGISVTFTRLGSALRAQTLKIRGKDVVVSLGTGRIYVRP